MLEAASATFKSMLTALSQRFGRAPLADRDMLVEFLHTRSAYVAQTALFGYLKTRMGTRHREMFQDQAFSDAMAQARHKVFLACLSDLTVFAIAIVASRTGLAGDGATIAAQACYEDGIAGALGGAAPTPASATDVRSAIGAFAERTATTDWSSATDPTAAFSESPGVLVDAAPVIEQFRELDREIVENSIRFRWIDVRRQLLDRLDADALARDLRRED